MVGILVGCYGLLGWFCCCFGWFQYRPGPTEITATANKARVSGIEAKSIASTGDALELLSRRVKPG
jgi:hypothetical protein